VVAAGLIVTVSPAAPPLLLQVLVESSDAWMSTPKPAVSTAAAPTPAAIDLMILYIRPPKIFIAIGEQCRSSMRQPPPIRDNRLMTMTFGLRS
jgi:hypothetical protein